MNTSKKIICVHLFNDYSGSPLVFAQAIESLIQGGATIELYTNKHQGFLSNLEQVNYQHIPYKWSKNPLITLWYFLYVQVWLWWILPLRYRGQNVTIYINTVLPFGAALAGFMMGARVVYHLHETSVKPKVLKRFLFGVANQIASDVIYVSNFLMKTERLQRPQRHCIHNVLPKDFARQAAASEEFSGNQDFHILMLCSLKAYKGVHEYISLAESMPDYRFTLVLNSSWDAINSFFQDRAPWPKNLFVFPAQSNVHPFFQKADLVLNLSHPDAWVETFGMTILEGMAYGLPAIVPPIGGVTELIDDGKNGYHIHPKNTQELQTAILTLASQPDVYAQFQGHAKKKAQTFSRLQFALQVNQLINRTLIIRKNYENEKKTPRIHL